MLLFLIFLLATQTSALPTPAPVTPAPPVPTETPGSSSGVPPDLEIGLGATAGVVFVAGCIVTCIMKFKQARASFSQAAPPIGLELRVNDLTFVNEVETPTTKYIDPAKKAQFSDLN